jgi:V8-like Glu-specific endopeptidase
MKLFFALLIPIFLISCGDSNKKTEKVTKGHREAIKYQCSDASDVKACGLEVRRNFIEDGNEYENLAELNKGQVNKIKTECMRAKSFGLESYNNCLSDLRAKAEGGSLWDKSKNETIVVDKGGDHIDSLRAKTVVVQIIYEGANGDLLGGGAGSGVIVKKDLIATNCHVTNAAASLSKDYKTAILVKEINKKNFAKVTLYKEAQENDICIVKKTKNSEAEFSFPNKPVKRLIKFDKLKQGVFVRTFGSPTGDDDGVTTFEGHTAEGTINYLGTVGKTSWSWSEDLSPETKLIVHSAAINFGNSGGPLFDKDGNLIGINSSGDPGGKFNIAVSADHVIDLLKE